MTLLSDEIIEKAARAQCIALALDPDELYPREGGGDAIPLWRFQQRAARAALTAILPDVVEAIIRANIKAAIPDRIAGLREAAEIVGDHLPASQGTVQSRIGDALADVIAAIEERISSLSPNVEGE